MYDVGFLPSHDIISIEVAVQGFVGMMLILVHVLMIRWYATPTPASHVPSTTTTPAHCARCSDPKPDVEHDNDNNINVILFFDARIMCGSKAGDGYDTGTDNDDNDNSDTDTDTDSDTDDDDDAVVVAAAEAVEAHELSQNGMTPDVDITSY